MLKYILALTVVALSIVTLAGNGYAQSYGNIGSAYNGQNYNQQFHDHNKKQFLIKNEFDFNDVIVKQKQVEFDASYFLGLKGYYDVVNQLQYEDAYNDRQLLLQKDQQLEQVIGALTELVKQRSDKDPEVAELIKLVNLLIQERQGSPPVVVPTPTPQPQPQPEPTPTPEPTPQPQPQPIPEPVPAPEPTQPPTESELDKAVFKIFIESCKNCHGPASAKAGLQLIGQDDDGTNWLNDLSLEDRVKTYDRVAGIKLKERGLKLMPLGGPALPDDQVETLRLWMVQKAE